MSLDRAAVVAALPAYEIGDELGRGAFGVVVAGVHRTLGRPVAIKQLPRAFAADPKVRERFLAEARTLATFDHPHVVAVYDVVEHDGVCVLVMERLAGGTLGELARRGPLDPRTACSVVVAAAAGLAYAHDQGVLHRDVKPDNLMFTEGGVLKVTDFGLAKAVGTGPTRAADGGLLGTPAYLAPEQAQGRPLTPAADVYALGTVLYELLSGTLPYPHATNPLAALYLHVHEDPVPIREAAPDLPELLADVVDAAIARAVEDRYAGAADLGAALEAAAASTWGPTWAGDAPTPGAAGRPVDDAPPVGPEPRSGGPDRHRRARRRAGAAVLGLVVAVAAATAVLRSGDGAPPRPVATSTTSPSGPTTGATTAFAVDPTTAPVGTTVRLASSVACPAGPSGVGPTAAYLRLVDPRQAEVDGGEVVGRQLPVAADGTWTLDLVLPRNLTPGPVALRVECLGPGPDGPTSVGYGESAPVALTVTDPSG